MKKGSLLDKVVKGLIIGGAIGSVVGGHVISKKPKKRPWYLFWQRPKAKPNLLRTIGKGIRVLITGKK